MKTIYLLRHAKSEWANENLTDIDRPLNERGYRDANEMSLRLRDQQIRPDLMLSSSAIRTTSTALIFARTIGYPEAEIDLRPDMYHTNHEHYLDILRNLSDKVNSVIMVGHNPTITDAANALTNGGTYDFPTCALLALHANITKWSDLQKCKEAFYDYPKSLNVK